ncbi:barstar family protein [Pantanalinema rosaneae CENA516]|uniref:barstar family protein n=1 Tax=Pantanalinema rosaneae TaxID=1620701 RepID=UPI003D6F83D7
MEPLIAILTNQSQAGIYQLSTEVIFEELFKWCQQQDFQLVSLDGQTITNKLEFLKACAQAMEFPPYFGLNWDAFEDSLTDLDWLPAQGYVVLYDYPERFAQADPGEWATALEIFQAAIEYWQDANVPMYILLKTSSPSFGNIAKI